MAGRTPELITIHDEQLPWNAAALGALLATTDPATLPDAHYNPRYHSSTNPADRYSPFHEFISVLPPHTESSEAYVLRVQTIDSEDEFKKYGHPTLEDGLGAYAAELQYVRSIAAAEGIGDLIAKHSIFLAPTNPYGAHYKTIFTVAEKIGTGQAFSDAYDPEYCSVHSEITAADIQASHRELRSPQLQLRLLALGRTLTRYLAVDSNQQIITGLGWLSQYAYPDVRLFDMSYELTREYARMTRPNELYYVLDWVQHLAPSRQKGQLLHEISQFLLASEELDSVLGTHIQYAASAITMTSGKELTQAEIRSKSEQLKQWLRVLALGGIDTQNPLWELDGKPRE